MGKILSQSGVSLADTYDIEGSIAGVENLESSDVHLFDEMGGRVFSERLRSFNVQIEVSPLQSADFSVAAGGIPDSPNRVLTVCVMAENAGAVLNVQISMRNLDTSNEIPIFVWDSVVDTERVIEWTDSGGATAPLIYLVNAAPAIPELMTRYGDAGAMGDFIMRGTTTAFGAGNEDIRGLIHLVRANRGAPTPGEPSSHGLPLPGW
ncbi:MAG: hypothetical protein V3T08_10175 [Gemmatimonadota bacterium]